MSMSRKHFNQFASVIAANVEEAQALMLDDDANRDDLIGYIRGQRDAAVTFASIAQRDNSLFDRERFMRACGF